MGPTKVCFKHHTPNSLFKTSSTSLFPVDKNRSKTFPIGPNCCTETRIEPMAQ
ncbi:hypothetical protein HanIR_Chr14g0688381 [Helianthus annuus]|nr:hypothetical protein HanIR_Chr14g0688381 [Helianthus annuus]